MIEALPIVAAVLMTKARLMLIEVSIMLEVIIAVIITLMTDIVSVGTIVVDIAGTRAKK
jgi:hypothetical protein